MLPEPGHICHFNKGVIPWTPCVRMNDLFRESFMIDYAKKQKPRHQILFVLLIIIGALLLGASFWQEHEGVYRGSELAHSVFWIHYLVGLLFVIVAGLWKAVIRLSSEVAALEAKSKDVR
jgi:hypothetical protein